jgi:uncharacterized membrane protein
MLHLTRLNGWSVRRRIIMLCIVITALMCLFPPWRIQVPQQGISVGVGYSFLLSNKNPFAHIDLGRLVVQIFLVALGGAGAVVYFERQRAIRPETDVEASREPE